MNLPLNQMDNSKALSSLGSAMEGNVVYSSEGDLRIGYPWFFILVLRSRGRRAVRVVGFCALVLLDAGK